MNAKTSLFNGKTLTNGAGEAYRLTWPFLAWCILLVALYANSYTSLGEVNAALIELKLGQRTIAQSSRVLYYANEITLNQVGGVSVLEHQQHTFMCGMRLSKKTYSVGIMV